MGKTAAINAALTIFALASPSGVLTRINVNAVQIAGHAITTRTQICVVVDHSVRLRIVAKYIAALKNQIMEQMSKAAAMLDREILMFCNDLNPFTR